MKLLLITIVKARGRPINRFRKDNLRFENQNSDFDLRHTRRVFRREKTDFEFESDESSKKWICWTLSLVLPRRTIERRSFPVVNPTLAASCEIRPNDKLEDTTKSILQTS